MQVCGSTHNPDSVDQLPNVNVSKFNRLHDSSVTTLFCLTIVGHTNSQLSTLFQNVD
jgi:hypothetical protein